ncbi:hypothetical protein D3C77_583540 [compost metagenome]
MSGQTNLLSTEWTNFKSAIKKGDSNRASDALARLLTLSASVNKYKQNIYNMEVSISDIIKRSKTSLTHAVAPITTSNFFLTTATVCYLGPSNA